MRAMLHLNGDVHPRETVIVDMKVTADPGYGRGADGYGRKIATEYMVRFNGRWRRVYACCISNAASHYIGRPGKWEALFERID